MKFVTAHAICVDWFYIIVPQQNPWNYLDSLHVCAKPITVYMGGGCKGIQKWSQISLRPHNHTQYPTST